MGCVWLKVWVWVQASPSRSASTPRGAATTVPLQGGHQDRVGGTRRGHDTTWGPSGLARPWQGVFTRNLFPKPGPGEPKPSDAHHETAPADNSCHTPSPYPESGAAPTPLGPPHVPDSPTPPAHAEGGQLPPPGACSAKLGWGQSSSSSSSCHEDPPSVAQAGLSILETPSHSSRPQHVTPHIQASHEPSCKPPASQPRAKRVPPRGDVPGWTGPVCIPRSRAQALAAARSWGWRQHLSSP